MRPGRVAVGWVVALAGVVAAGEARAQAPSLDMYAHEQKNFESPQHFALEVRFGPYTPDVDSDPAFNGATPYGKTFGSCGVNAVRCPSPPKLMGGAEFDWQALRIPHLGTLGPGLGMAYSKSSGKAQFTQQHNGQTTSGEDTSLEIIPFYGIAVLRVDVLWREYGVPLVPWAKAGLGFAFWRASNTLGTSSFTDPTTGQSTSGEGHSLGTHFALGLGLNLNWLDPYAAKGFDTSMGVNNTYLFAEWTREDLGGNNAMRVGGTEWTFGLALEF